MSKLVSIIIPVYNSAKFVAETVNSALSSEYKEFEIIIIDDGSNDESLKICEQIASENSQIRILKHKDNQNKGVIASRKLGVDNAKGDFIYFLDSDDILYPKTLTNYIDIFEKHHDITLIHGEVDIVGDCPKNINPQAGFIIGNKDRKYNLPHEAYFLESNRICTSTVCVKRAVLEKIDFEYDNVFLMAEDWMMLTLLGIENKFYYYSKPAIKYRVHPDSATFIAHNKGEQYLNYNKLEYYLCLLIKIKDKDIQVLLKDKIQDLTIRISDFYRQYSIINKHSPLRTIIRSEQDNTSVSGHRSSVIENNQHSTFNSTEEQTKLLKQLKTKNRDLMHGYGYYFYFIYKLRKLFKRKP
ncbi:MAG: hypothetical protein C0596_08585 [Marinilabiliales bacterium]|nr:MAG: hypothetical protein C0596_08585 [Marinilabiliales bacterium]